LIIFFFQAEDGIRDRNVTGVQTCALPISVITDYYPKRMVYPFGKVDKHIDSRLTQAATIAQERAHAHSRSRCWHYVKDALLASGVIDSRPKTELARDAASELVNNYGFKRLSVTDPFSAPVGSVLV